MADLGFIFDPRAVTPSVAFSDLPSLPALNELKARRQWVCWQYEKRVSADGTIVWTKPPVSALTGRKASVNEPRDWATYQRALDRVLRDDTLAGIGLALSSTDNLWGGDMDHVRDAVTHEITSEHARRIVAFAETYIEASPSGLGLRIMGRGKIERTFTDNDLGIECYGTGRYLTITGHHIPGTPVEICHAPQTIEYLRSTVEARKAEKTRTQHQVKTPESAKEEARAAESPKEGSDFFRTVNDKALADLDAWVPILLPAAKHQGSTRGYRVKSKDLGRNLQEDLGITPQGIKDWGVADMGDARLGARTPIDLVIEYGGAPDPISAARWLCTQMGVTPEALGWRDETLEIGREATAAILARAVATDEEGVERYEDTQEPVPPPAEPARVQCDYPDEKLKLGGLVGDIADWIMATSMFPNRLFATVAALSVVSTAVARQVYTGTPRSSSALYFMMIAPTAGGKDRPQEAVKQLLGAAGLQRMVKGAMSSSAKLGLSMAEQPAQIQVVDEVGKVLRKFVSRHSSSQELALLDDYCSIWGKNLGSFEPEGVTTRTDISVKQPALVFLGATTPSAFYSQLRASQVAGGFLNRFLVCQRYVRVEANEEIQPEEMIPPHLVDAVRRLAHCQDGEIVKPSSLVSMSDQPPPMIVVPPSPDAQALLDAYSKRAFGMIKQSDTDPVLEVWARAAEMVKRLSLVVACGRHWFEMRACRMEAADVEFAQGLVDWCMEQFVDGLRTHMAENEYQANSKTVINIIRSAGCIRRSDLLKRLDRRLDARSVNAIVDMALETGEISQEIDTCAAGRPATRYTYRGF